MSEEKIENRVEETAPETGEKSEAPFVLTPENYYGPEADRLYLSNTRFKEIYGYPANPYPCEAAALFGEKPRTEALIAGGYVDAAFESDDALKNYIENNASDLRMKSGKSYYKFVSDANLAIERARQDKIFMSYLDGEHQRVMTGMIAGHMFKIKMDDYKPKTRITDLKYVKSAAEEWNEPLRRRTTFIEAYGYDIQGAIYREIVRQNTGWTLPFYIAYITKEQVPDFGVVEIPPKMLDDALDFVMLSLRARPLSEVKKAPVACGRRSCPFCRGRKVLTGAYTYEEFTERSRT